MSLTSYRGLTWDHPRGYRALEAAAQDIAPGQGLSILWDRHSLEGFEAAPIAELAEHYDLIVLDHPHVGEAVAQDCLLPMASLLAVRGRRGDRPVARQLSLWWVALGAAARCRNAGHGLCT
jgi:hypothetical protein